MDLQHQIDMIITAASQFCEDFKKALEMFSDEIIEAYTSMQEAWEELLEYVYDCAEEEKKKFAQRKRWAIEAKAVVRPLLVDKRPKIHRCRNAC